MDSEFVGVTVLPEYIQSEGVTALLDRLHGVGVTAVSTSPYLMKQVSPDEGHREPPIDAGAGSVRLLDRELWGKLELWVQTAPSFASDRDLYKGLRYQPDEPTDLTAEQGHIIHEFIREAHARGMTVTFQIQAAIPPAYRVQFGGPVDDDIPTLPTGEIPRNRLANNGSLASPHIRDYHAALTRDLLRHYPEIDGIRYDWPEYPPYFIDTVFADFSHHASTVAAEMGVDFDRMKQAAGDFRAKLQRLRDDDLDAATFESVADDREGVGDWLDFKAALVERYLRHLREVMDQEATGKLLLPNAFPPPWSRLSGMDFGRIAPIVDGIGMKLYTMHWPMMLRNYGESIMKWNPELDEAKLCSALERWFNLGGSPPDTVAGFAYPSPADNHPVTADAMVAKINQASAASENVVFPIAHGYGPDDDYAYRLNVARQASRTGVYINRYAYLSDSKLHAIRG